MREDKPRALDLFCKAGGVTKGLQRAGFYVIGLDIEPQPHYCGDEFVLGDALDFRFSWTGEFVGGSMDRSPECCDRCGLDWDHHFDFVWASPPCQGYTSMNQRWNVKRDLHPRLIEPVRNKLDKSGTPYAIENVSGAPLIRPTVLCGQFFGLSVRRHRKIETSFAVFQPDCRPFHKPMPIAVYGDHPERHAPRRPGNGGYVNRAHDVEMASEAMGIDWMNWRELTQAIPPAYSEYIGREFLRCRQEIAA